MSVKRTLPSTIILAIVVIAGLGYFAFTKFGNNSEVPHDVSNSVRSIAILPFLNLSKDSTQQYLSEGFAEDILNSLSHSKHIKISGPSSSFKFGSIDINTAEIGKKLDVDNILSGSYQLLGDKFKFTAALINTRTGSNIWSATYVENIDDIFTLKNKITNDVEGKLNIASNDGNEQNSGKPTDNIDAYKSYLKGRSSWNLRTQKDLLNGIEFYRKAISLDSNYAAAYAGIADCYTALGYGNFLAPKASFFKAFEAATKALSLDSTLADAHASLGYFNFYYQWDWAAAEQQFRSALSLNPNYALAYDWYGYYLTAMKRYDEAKTVFSKAAELDPLAAPIVTDIAFGYYYKGDYDSAIKKLEQSLALNPKYGLAFLWMGRAYQAQKKYDEAIMAYQNGIKFMSGWPVALAQLGSVYGVKGDNQNAKIVLDSLMSIYPKKYVTAYGIALIHIALGDKEGAFEWLNRAYEEHTNWMVWLRSDPRWIPLESDKRYTELVNKVGLPQ